MWFGFKAITIEGVLAQLLMAAGCLAFGYLAITAPQGSWKEIAFSALFLAVGIGGYVVVFHKLEGEF